MLKKTLMVSLVVLFLIPTASALAQGVVQRGGYSSGRYAMNWLRNEQVRKELEILDYQIEKIEKVQSKLQSDVQTVYADIRKLPREEQTEQYRLAREKAQRLYSDAETQLKDILLPQQIERLQQVTTQMQMRGSMSYGMRGELAEKLEISEEQQKELREKAAEKNKELYKKYAEMRAEMQKELLGEVLTDEQQKMLKELIGEPFEYKHNYGSGTGGARSGGGS